MVINSIYPTSILEKGFQTIVFQRFFIASNIEVKRKAHRKVHRKADRKRLSAKSSAKRVPVLSANALYEAILERHIKIIPRKSLYFHQPTTSKSISDSQYSTSPWISNTMFCSALIFQCTRCF